MDSIRITGGKRLEGKIPISGAKNSALTLLPCALLTDEKLTLANLPRLADVDNFSHLLNQLGVSTKVACVKKGETGRSMTLEAGEIASTVAPYDMVPKCGRRSWCWDPCWPAPANRPFRCPVPVRGGARR